MAGNGTRALIFLVNIAFTLYIAVLYLRVLLQRLGADYYNPVVQFIVRVTNPLLRPLRKVVPAAGGWDLAALLLAVLCAFLNGWLVLSLVGLGARGDIVARYSLLKLLSVLINLYIFSLLAQAILSWVNPRHYNPVAAVLWRLNEPLMRPVRRLIPTIGTIDLSPLVLIIALEAVSILLGLPGYLS